jgi:hypothetical protein
LAGNCASGSTAIWIGSFSVCITGADAARAYLPSPPSRLSRVAALSRPPTLSAMASARSRSRTRPRAPTTRKRDVAGGKLAVQTHAALFLGFELLESAVI